MKTIALAALPVALAPVRLHANQAEPSRLILTFETGADTGAVMVSAFNSEAAYGRRAAIRQARVVTGG